MSSVNPPVHRRPFRVFLSYARADNDTNSGLLVLWARYLMSECEKLLGEPVQLFVDELGIPAGAEFPDKIKLEVCGADVLLVFVTSGYPRREWCRHEIELFKSSSKDRGLENPNLFLVGVGNGSEDALKELGIDSKQLALKIGDRWDHAVPKAAKMLAEMLEPLAPRQTKGRRMDPTAGGVPPGHEVYQYLSALDSVRSQRDRNGSPQQTCMVDLRAKLSYLMGYTVVVSESQAFDSLGAIHTISEASKAWRQHPGAIAPFRIPFFRVPKPHVVDILLAKFKDVDRGAAFDFSAWRRHQHNREGGALVRTTLQDAKEFEACWEHFLESARFLSWFPADNLAQIAPVSLDVYLGYLIQTYSGPGIRSPASAIMDDIHLVMQEVKHRGNRTELYQAADGFGAQDWKPERVEAVKDVIDVAYNRTVADSLLHAATSNRRARSMCLTDPTPDLRAPGFDDAVQSLLGYRDVDKPDSHAYARFQGAWEGRQSKGIAPALSWAAVFEVTSDPQWHALRHRVIGARLGDSPLEEWQEAVMKMSEWIESQLKGNVVLDPLNGRVSLRAHGFEAGIGGRPVDNTGMTGEGAA